MIVVASPDVTAVAADAGAPAPVTTSSFALTLTGVDGSTWDLVNGPIRLMSGVQAFAAPTVSHWMKTAPAIDGSRWDGSRTPQSDGVVLPLGVMADDWQTWLAVDGALFQAIHPSGEAMFTVTRPDGTSRTQRLRFVAGGGVDESDPLVQLFATYAIEFVAANPFWVGDPIATSFTVADPLPLFPGPAFNINPSSTTTGATVTNPGDEPAYPRYVVQGPATSWSVGVGADRVSSDTPLTSSQSVSIDMDPTKLTVLDQDGNNAYAVLDEDAFSSIPARSDVNLAVSLAGYGSTSSISVEFTPMYRRPW